LQVSNAPIQCFFIGIILNANKTFSFNDGIYQLIVVFGNNKTTNFRSGERFTSMSAAKVTATSFEFIYFSIAVSFNSIIVK
jgi:hypothetical protein